MIATWLLATPVNLFFPVAPPRLAYAGAADAVSHAAGAALTGRSTMFYNQFAAVPSLHVGFAVAVGIAVAATCRSRAIRVVVALWGPVVALTVVATANHYLFDVATRIVACAAGCAAGQAMARLAGDLAGATSPDRP